MEELVRLFEYIPMEIIVIIMSSVGDVGYVIMANVCRTWKIIVNKSFHNCIIPKNKFIKNAAKMGYLCIVKWARENNCSWDSSTCSNAARGGHLEVSNGPEKTIVHGIVQLVLMLLGEAI